MFVKYLSLLPEVLLLLNVVVMQLLHLFRSSQTPKTFATVSKFFVGAALAACIVFYNLSFDAAWYVNSPYTTFFKGLMLFSALVSNFLACKWFLNQDQSSLGYYQAVSLSLLCFCAAISCRSLWILCPALAAGFVPGLILVGIHYDAAVKRRAVRSFCLNGLVFLLLLGSGSCLLSLQAGGMSYSALQAYYQNEPGLAGCIGAGLLVGALLYMLGAAPFHQGFLQIIRFSVLPAAVFFTIIPVLAGTGVLLTFFHTVFAGIDEYLRMLLKICGIFSVTLGVIGANSRGNIRQIFSCVGLFYVGIVLLMLSPLSLTGMQSGVICLLVYLLSVFGVLTCFYGMRSHGEYVQDIEKLSGMAEVKPYISAALLVFAMSLLGMPPLLGMLGSLTIVGELLEQGGYGLILFVFLMLAWLAHGMLEVIRSIYFDDRKHSFDRADKGVYFCLLVNILLILAVAVRPGYLMYDIEEMMRLFLRQV